MDDLAGESMQLEDVILVQLGHSLQSHSHTGGYHMDLLGKPIHKHTDGIVSLGLWKRSNQVHADLLPRLSGYIVGVQWVVGALTYWLHPLALLTALHVLPDVPLDAWPPVVASDELVCLVPARVSSQGGVVVEPDNVLPELGILGDVYSLFPSDCATLPLAALVQPL